MKTTIIIKEVNITVNGQPYEEIQIWEGKTRLLGIEIDCLNRKDFSHDYIKAVIASSDADAGSDYTESFENLIIKDERI